VLASACGGVRGHACPGRVPVRLVTSSLSESAPAFAMGLREDEDERPLCLSDSLSLSLFSSILNSSIGSIDGWIDRPMDGWMDGSDSISASRHDGTLLFYSLCIYDDSTVLVECSGSLCG